MRIGTRESLLAMRQTEMFVSAMKERVPDIDAEVVGMTSLGDVDQVSPLDSMGSTGAFVRELDEALVEGRVDCTVNSLKDIPVTMDPRLAIGAMLPRDDPRDVVLPCSLEELPPGARVGTSSTRRTALLASLRPDLAVVPLRGNIHTRLSKLDSGECDAIVLAKAGLDRMGIDRPMSVLDPKVFVPSPAQGIIAVECRRGDAVTSALLSKVEDRASRIEAGVERGILKLMQAGCSSPVGITAELDGDVVHVDAVSFGYAESERRVSIDVPAMYVLDELLGIAEFLAGKRDAVI